MAFPKEISSAQRGSPAVGTLKQDVRTHVVGVRGSARLISSPLSSLALNSRHFGARYAPLFSFSSLSVSSLPLCPTHATTITQDGRESTTENVTNDVVSGRILACHSPWTVFRRPVTAPISLSGRILGDQDVCAYFGRSQTAILTDAQ